MKIKIQEIPSEGMSVPLSTVLLANKSLALSGSVSGKLFVKKESDQSVYIRGSLSASLLVSCRRCLSAFGYPIESEFHLDYTPEIKNRLQQDRELHKEEMDSQFYRGDTLDIDGILEDQLYLETPMAPLCKADCKGLCPTCGEDLNQETHICIKREGQQYGESKT